MFDTTDGQDGLPGNAQRLVGLKCQVLCPRLDNRALSTRHSLLSYKVVRQSCGRSVDSLTLLTMLKTECLVVVVLLLIAGHMVLQSVSFSLLPELPDTVENMTNEEKWLDYLRSTQLGRMYRLYQEMNQIEMDPTDFDFNEQPFKVFGEEPATSNMSKPPPA